MMPGLALTVATLWTVATVPGRPGGDGDDAGVHCGASPGRPEFGRPGPPRLEQQPDEYANHSMKEKKEQWYCRQDVLGTGQ